MNIGHQHGSTEHKKKRENQHGTTGRKKKNQHGTTGNWDKMQFYDRRQSNCIGEDTILRKNKVQLIEGMNFKDTNFVAVENTILR